MSENPIPERADVRQLRIQAKELLKELRKSDPTVQLADVQWDLARKHGFASWPRLVEDLEVPQLVERLKRAIEGGHANRLERLLKVHAPLRRRLNEPLFEFDSPPIVRASRHRDAAKLLPVLVRYGADPNVRSTWWAGGFGALDGAEGEAVELLLSLGAKWDVWSASAHGRVDALRDLLDEDPSRVNAPGGDGERPLHFAGSAEVAELLIARGADLEARDVDHESTPIQYQVTNAAVLRALLKHGAKPDVFTAAVTNDVEMLRRIVAEDPNATLARVGEAPFSTRKSDGGHIYTYRLGGMKTPQQVAAHHRSLEVLREMEAHGPPSRILAAAAWMEDAETIARLKGTKIEPGDASAIAWAAHDGREKTVSLLLEAGFDPLATGMDSGTSLHVACWFGHLPVVRLLIGKVPLETRDAHHGSTPLGWACHGAQWCHNEKGDYPGIVEALLEAGADVKAPANKDGTSILDQAGDREDVKAVLRRHGA